MNKKYQTFSAGCAGNGKVDLATGGLEFVHEDTRSDSSTLPISVSHVYSSKSADAESPYGKDFKLNLQQTLSFRDGDDTKWKYTDGNGIEHKFKERYYYKVEETDEKGQPCIRKDFESLKGKKSSDFHIDQQGRIFEKSTYSEVLELREGQQVKVLLNKGFSITNVSSQVTVGPWEYITLLLDDGTEIEYIVQIVNTAYGLEAKYEIHVNGKQVAISIRSFGFYEMNDGNLKMGPHPVNIVELDGFFEFRAGANTICKFTVPQTAKNITISRAGFSKVTLEHTALKLGIKQVFSEIRTKSGLQLQTQLKDFCGSKKIETRQQELMQAEEELRSLQRSRDELGFSVGVELDGRTEEQLFTIIDNANLSLMELKDKQRYYKILKKKYERAIEKDNNQSFYQINEYNNLKTETGFGAKDTSAANLEILSAFVTSQGIKDYYNRDNFDGNGKLEPIPTNATSSHRDNLRNQFNIQQSYTMRLEKLKKSMDNITSDFTEKHNSENLEHINTLIEQKEVICKYLREQLPENFIIEGDLIFGFSHVDKDNNSIGKLVSIFDSNDNQVAIIYEKDSYGNDRIAKVVGNNEKEISFEYAGGKLISITDCEDRKTQFEYTGDLLSKVIYPNGEKSIFRYMDDLLYEIISPSGIGIELHFTDGKVTSIASKSYLKQSLALPGTTQQHSKAISVDGYELLPLSSALTCNLFSIAYNKQTTTVSELTGENTAIEKGVKEISHFNVNGDLVAEYSAVKLGSAYTPERISLYDEKKNSYKFVYENTDLSSKTVQQIEQIVSDYIAYQDYGDDIINYVKNIFQHGDWTLTELDPETGNAIAEYNNEKVLLNNVKCETKKSFKYDEKTNLLIEEKVEKGLIEWSTSQATLPTYAEWKSVAYGNGKFVAVALYSNVAAISTDGVTWTQSTLPAFATWTSITYGNNMFVAVAGDNIAATSPDGITWTQNFLSAPASWSSVTYGNGIFAAVAGDRDIVATSEDGISWRKRVLPTFANWKSVTYGNGAFVAIATSSDIAAKSTDGVRWTQGTLPVSAEWYSVTYGKGTFVAVAASGNIAATSTDGITWTQRTLPVSAGWVSVSYGNGMFVAIASGNSNIAATSPDGITWTQKALPVPAYWSSVLYGGDKFVAVVNGGSIAATIELDVLIKEIFITKYEYNKQGKLIRTIDPKGIISETMYDKRGNVVKTLTYHKDKPATKFCKKREVAENGQISAEVNDFCESKTRFEYVDGTGLIETLDTGGKVTAFGYDKHTDDVIEICSAASGDVNGVVYKYTADYLTKLASGNTEIKYTYDEWGISACFRSKEQFLVKSVKF